MRPTDGTDPEREVRCALCGRAVSRLTRHHLRPRSEGGLETERLCGACHRQVHALFTNRTLAVELDTVDKLRANEQIARYLRWAEKQHDRHIRVRKSRSRR